VVEPIDHQQPAQTLVEQARAEVVELVGPGGLLTGLTKTGECHRGLAQRLASPDRRADSTGRRNTS
jgi:hypothetical protein